MSVLIDPEALRVAVLGLVVVVAGIDIGLAMLMRIPTDVVDPSD